MAPEQSAPVEEASVHEVPNEAAGAPVASSPATNERAEPLEPEGDGHAPTGTGTTESEPPDAEGQPTTASSFRSEPIKWYRSINFYLLGALTLIPLWDLVGIIVTMNTQGRDLVVAESARLIEQLGNNAISEIDKRSHEIESLARSLATMGETLPKDVGIYKTVLPAVLDFDGDADVAGGGIWPEPHAFRPGVEKRSFFYGRTPEGKLKYFDDYNHGRGYHHDEWYPVVRYSQDGSCFWSKSYMDPYSYQPMVTCTVAMRKGDRFLGVSTIDLKLEGLHAFMERIQVRTGGYVFLLDRNNRFLTFPQPELVKNIGKDEKGKRTEEFQTVNQFAERQPLFVPIAEALEEMNRDILKRARAMKTYRPDIVERIDRDSDQIDRQDAEFIAAIIADPLGEMSKKTYLYRQFPIPSDFLTQEESLVFIFNVPSSYWKLVAVKPVSEAGAVAAKISNVIVLIISVTILVGVGIAAVFLHYFLHRPLKQTTESVQVVGELVSRRQFEALREHRVPVKADNELGRLAEVINTLGSELQSSYGSLVQLNATLEKKVETRTRNLKDSLEAIRELKFQQDGDYFLTSLLVQPLGGNHSRSETVAISEVVRQKKKFRFKKWDEEIGGDICAAHSLQLGNKPFTVFLNADAMGKSMQGAGGVLVLGAIFEATIERTRLSSEVASQSPERWLKNAITDLQKVFESFGGSMLISAVVGLVDDGSGTLYFLNAEHPSPVLFRNGRARLYLEERQMRKIGFQAEADRVVVNVLELQPGDVMIFGSDGRDDLLLGTDDAGNRVINEDEELFGRIVEEAQGDLEAIVRALETHGEFTDDLSLLRVAFLEGAQSSGEQPPPDSRLEQARTALKERNYAEALALSGQVLSSQPNEARALKMQTQALAGLKRYGEALATARSYLDIKPADTEFLDAAARCAGRAGEIETAIDLAEQYHLRRPGDARNLSFLIKAYEALGSHARVATLEKELAAARGA